MRAHHQWKSGQDSVGRSQCKVQGGMLPTGLFSMAPSAHFLIECRTTNSHNGLNPPQPITNYKNSLQGLERWLWGKELWLFCQRSWVQSQKPRVGSQSSVMGSDALFWCAWRQLRCTHIHKINNALKKEWKCPTGYKCPILDGGYLPWLCCLLVDPVSLTELSWLISVGEDVPYSDLMYQDGLQPHGAASFSEVKGRGK